MRMRNRRKPSKNQPRAHLVRLLLREAHDLVLDRGAVARPRRVDPPPVDGRLREVVAQDRVRRGRRAREPAGELRALDVRGRVEREPARVRVARLLLKRRVVDRAAVDARRRPRLEAARLEAERDERLGQPLGGRLARAAGRERGAPDPDAPVHERAGREDRGGAAVPDAKVGRHAAEAAVGVEDDARRHALADVEARLLFQDAPHPRRVLDLVRLAAERPDRGPLGGVEHALL